MRTHGFISVAVLCLASGAAFPDAVTPSGPANDVGQATVYVRLRFEDIDKNMNGFIEKTEMVAFGLDAELFKKMDRNSDGRVSRAEFDAYQAMTAGNAVPKVK